MGSNVRLIGPPTLLPNTFKQLGVDIYHHMDEGVKDVDVIMMLRLQRERMSTGLVPSAKEYFRFFGLDHRRLNLARKNALVMHPGPMNRGIEIESSVADSDQSVIQKQVEMGVAVRMAVLDDLTRGKNIP